MSVFFKFIYDLIKNLNGKKEIKMEKIEYFLLRRKKNIKLREIANFIDCSIALLSLFENDKANLDINKQIKYRNFIENY